MNKLLDNLNLGTPSAAIKQQSLLLEKNSFQPCVPTTEAVEAVQTLLDSNTASAGVKCEICFKSRVEKVCKGDRGLKFTLAKCIKIFNFFDIMGVSQLLKENLFISSLC